jgi:hypothetical protein
MIGHLYRYPHPQDSAKFIYVGQGAKRDVQHRRGKSSFGRRFLKLFPGVELPQPIREVVKIENNLELNELETIHMFQYHTWCGYPNGMNLRFPGDKDYLSLGKMAAEVTMRLKVGVCFAAKEKLSKWGKKGGEWAASSGQLETISQLPQAIKRRKENGRLQVTNGNLEHARNSPQKAKSIAKQLKEGHCKRICKLGAHGGHEYWHVRRGIMKLDCKFCQQLNSKV